MVAHADEWNAGADEAVSHVFTSSNAEAAVVTECAGAFFCGVKLVHDRVVDHGSTI